MQLARGSANSKHRTMTVTFPIHPINNITLLGKYDEIKIHRQTFPPYSY
jgi:hypothetical protein